jgi:CheY-like chemotaxis protein
MFSHSRKSIIRFLSQIQQASLSYGQGFVYENGANTAANILSNECEITAQEVLRKQNLDSEFVDPEGEGLDLSFFKILVAEDNLINQKIMQKMLQKMDARFKIVNNGAEAVEALRNDYFDMVLMDCYMPQMSGFEAAAVIRASQERFASIPLIACSAGFMDDDIKTSRDVGMNDYLLKPVTFDQLRGKVRKWASRIYADLSVLDTSSLDKIRIFDDQHQTLLRSLYQIYSENTQDELYNLRDLIQDGTEELIRKKAHMLKSSASQLGAFRFEKFCILMEHEESFDRERAKKLFAGMSVEYENSRRRFSEYCQNLSQISNVLM